MSSEAEHLSPSEPVMLHSFCRRVQELHFYVCESLIRKYGSIRHAEHVCINCTPQSNNSPLTITDHCSPYTDQSTEYPAVKCSVETCTDPTAGLSTQVVQEFSSLRPLYQTLSQSTRTVDDNEVSYSRRLLVCNHQLSVVDRFLEIHTSLTNVAKLVNSKHYKAAADCLSNITLECEGPLTEREAEVQVTLRTELIIARERLLMQLTEIWNQSFQWNVDADVVTLVFVRGERFSDVVNALIICGKLDSFLQGLCNKFIQVFIADVVVEQKRIQRVSVTDGERSLNVRLIKQSGSVATPCTTLSSILSHLPELVSVLHTICHHGTDAQLLMQRLGNELLPRLGDALHDLVVLVLEETFVRGDDRLNSFVPNDLLLQIQHIDDEFSKSGMISGGGRTFSSFVDATYCVMRHRIKLLSEQAQRLMMEGLQFSLLITDQYPFGEEKEPNTEALEIYLSSIKDYNEQYTIPRCHVSVCIVQLIKLIYGLMSATDSHDQRLLLMIHDTVQNIIESYLDTVPVYHKQLLQSVPLVAALYYNNCMYLCHHLHIIDTTLNSVLASASSQSVNYQRLASRLKQQAQLIFNAFVEEKRQQLVDLLYDINNFIGVADDEGCRSQKTLQAVLCQLKHVAFVWRDIVPTAFFYKTLGTLINSVIHQLIKLIISITEYSDTDLSILAEQFNELQLALCQLVAGDDTKNPSVILQEHVSSWLRLSELIKLCRCSLSDIADRWSSGKGPLSLYFSVDEITSLIRAIFEDTSNRRKTLTELRQTID